MPTPTTTRWTTRTISVTTPSTTAITSATITMPWAFRISTETDFAPRMIAIRTAGMHLEVTGTSMEERISTATAATWCRSWRAHPRRERRACSTTATSWRRSTSIGTSIWWGSRCSSWTRIPSVPPTPTTPIPSTTTSWEPAARTRRTTRR